MNTNNLFELVKSGVKPIVKFTKDIHNYSEESVDPEMLGRIVAVNQEYEDSFRFMVDLNDFKPHNQSVASTDWLDEEGKPTRTWFQTPYYPKDGIEPVYLSVNTEAPLSIIENDSLFGKYIASRLEVTYVKWLEEQVLSLRKKH